MGIFEDTKPPRTGSSWLSASGSQGYRYPGAHPLYNTPLWPLLGPKTEGQNSSL